MRTYKLNRRYNAQKKWGFAHAVEFPTHEWQGYFALKRAAEKLLGHSTETASRYLGWKDAQLLQSAPWGYHYGYARKPTFIYFRAKDDMDKALVLLALTNG